MARGSVTEDELAAGIRMVGVLSAVTSPEGARRDNPFAGPATSPKDPSSAAATPRSRPEREQVAPTLDPLPDRRPGRPPRPSVEAPTPEPERYTDPVTVPMTAEMRTRANLLAAELQRRRTEKHVRFTSNTVFRVAIEAFFERFELAPEDRPNTEDELRRLVHERIVTGRRTKRGTP